MRCAALIYGHEPHHIDHIAVLAAILEIPLLLTEHELFQSVQKFYPSVTPILCDYLELPNYLISQYDCIFYAMPRDLFDEVFFLTQKLHNKKIHTIWCPHGNSDKGYLIPYMEALKKEEIALVYGKKMIDFLKQKQSFSQLKACVEIGNFRHAFYSNNRPFYDKLVQKHILDKLPPSEKNLLYAPTWDDYEKSSSFYEATEVLVKHLPHNWNLIIKLHPNLLKKDILATEKICALCEEHTHILVVSDFPPIYPLLNQIDIYIGDYSSIGYDFLTFNRPLFFCHPSTRPLPPELHLFRCGPIISHSHYSTLYETIDDFLTKPDPFESFRKQLYLETFGPDQSLKTTKEKILGSLDNFPDPELNFF